MTSYRLARHSLAELSSASAMVAVAGNIVGAQAQVLSAAQISLWARARISRLTDVEEAIWDRRALVRAWCMRRTMFLIPSEDLSLFSRGTTKRPEYNLRYAEAHIGARPLGKLMEAAVEILKETSTKSDIARGLKARGYELKFGAGGGWGDSRSVPWVKVGKSSLTVGFLLHVLGARHVLCSGPSSGNESTYVMADKWLPNWRDMAREKAEEELLVRYLQAYGPATINDYALWMGVYVRDAKEIWSRVASRMEQVEVDGSKSWMLASDLTDLENSRLGGHVLKMLPFFDSFILGHKSHLNIVDEPNKKTVYRPQGWVSPVVLLDGRAVGVWSHQEKKGMLEVDARLFSGLTQVLRSQIRAEAARLGSFLGFPDTKVTVG